LKIEFLSVGDGFDVELAAVVLLGEVGDGNSIVGTTALCWLGDDLELATGVVDAEVALG